MDLKLTAIAESKIRQLGGTVCGVVVQTEEGLAAVSDMGRVTWLSGDVIGKEQEPQSQQVMCEEAVKLKTDYIWCEYITRGKHYEVIGRTPDGCYKIVNDYGTEISVRINLPSAHLNFDGVFTTTGSTISPSGIGRKPIQISTKPGPFILSVVLAISVLIAAIAIASADFSHGHTKTEHPGGQQ